MRISLAAPLQESKPPTSVFVTSSLLAAATAAAVVAELHQLLRGGQLRLCQGLVGVGGTVMINIAT